MKARSGPDTGVSALLISVFNKDGILVFAYNVKKNTLQDAANSTANEIKKKGIKG